MTVSRIITAQSDSQLDKIAAILGWMRSDIWHRFGALAQAKHSLSDLRKRVPGLYKHLPVDGTIRAATGKDTFDDLKACLAASKQMVRKAIHRRAAGDKVEAKRLYTLLKQNKWLEDPFLHRQMRKHFKHGKIRNWNKFVVRSDMHTESIINNRLRITVKIAKKCGEDITLVTNSTGEGVDLRGRNLRILLRDGQVEIHYAYDKGPGRKAGDRVIGVDKGYSEAFVDSDGHFHGQEFGKIMSEYTEQVMKTGRARGELRAIERRHRAAGRFAKADRIRRNNLGQIKMKRRRKKAKARLRAMAFKAAHKLVDKAHTIAAEDLSKPFSSKKRRGKKFNRKMGMWAKGLLAEALASTTKQRSANLVLVNPAYSSQVSSRTGRLEGVRQGDRFITPDGEVLHADVNAARNLLNRLDDSEIGLYTPFKRVKEILKSRNSSEGVLPLNWLELDPEKGVNQVRKESHNYENG